MKRSRRGGKVPGSVRLDDSEVFNPTVNFLLQQMAEACGGVTIVHEVQLMQKPLRLPDKRASSCLLDLSFSFPQHHNM